MKVRRSMIAHWTIFRYEMARHSLAEKHCFEWIENNAKFYDKDSLDELHSDMVVYMNLSYRISSRAMKDTISFSKHIGAVMAGTNEIDHYRLCILNSRNSTVMFICEPLGTQRGKGLFKA